MKQGVLIFGAAGVGVKAKEILESQGYEVLAFTDNDINKWGKDCEGISVLPPKDICIEDYDLFAIGMYKHVEKIKKQLMNMGVKEDNITVPVPVPASLFYNDTIAVKERSYNSLLICVCVGGIECTGIKEKVGGFFDHVIRYDFENNFWAFTYYIRSIMQIISDKKSREFIKWFSLSEYDQLLIDIYTVKDKNRGKLDSFISEDNVHFFVSKNEMLRRMIYSNATFQFWMHRIPRAVDQRTKKRFEDLRRVLRNYNVPLDEVCVVSGTVLELFGLRETSDADDLDIIMTDRFRKLYGTGLIIVSDMIEIHPQNEFVDMNGKKIEDDDIIENEDMHFWFEGVKVVCLPLLYQQKKKAGIKRECKLIEYFIEGKG